MAHQFFPLVMIYMTVVGSVNYSFVKRCFTASIIYLAAAKVSPHEFVETSLYQSLLRTNLAEISLCESYIGYGITVPGHFVMYMGKDIRLLRGAYRESFVAGCWVRVGEIDEIIFDVTWLLNVKPFEAVCVCVCVSRVEGSVRASLTFRSLSCW